MKTLLWKDIRVNRMVLGYALAALAGVYLAAAIVNWCALWRYGFPLREWSEMLFLAGMMSLILEMPAAAMLGGCAFAAERADRSAEFIACLPIPRGRIVLSKATLALGALAIIWLVNSTVLYLVEVRLNPASGLGAGSVSRTLGIMGSISLCMFGVAWLSSACSSSHALAASTGIIVPVALALGVVGFAALMDLPQDTADRWMPRLCLGAGIVCFFAGVWYFLRRVEP